MAAIVSADVTAYSRLMGEDESRTLSVRADRLPSVVDVLDRLSFAFEELAAQRVKDIARPVEVYRVELTGATAEASRTGAGSLRQQVPPAGLLHRARNRTLPRHNAKLRCSMRH